MRLKSIDAKLLGLLTPIPAIPTLYFNKKWCYKKNAPYLSIFKMILYFRYVRRCSLDDEAEYKLIVGNREGEASCEARLKVVDQL